MKETIQKLFMFSKIDKKVLAGLVVVLIVLALVGIATYKYLAENTVEVQNSAGGASTENTDKDINGEDSQSTSDVQVDLGVQVEGGRNSGPGGLTICSDRCGDNVCQAQDSGCPEGSLNCICAETPAECPQDCGNY